jgi:GntP family gluconate:H+ symporter
VIIAGPIFGSFISGYVWVPWPALILGERGGATMSASAELAAQENPDAEDRRALRTSTRRDRDGRHGGTADLDRDGVPDRLEGDRLEGDRLEGDRLEGHRLEGERPLRRPGFVPTVLTVLLPVILMLARAIAEITLDDDSRLQAALVVIGNPVVALLTGVIVGMFTLGVASGMDRYRISASTGGALPAIAGILLIVGAGGGFKQTLIDSGVGNVIADAAEGANISALLLGWLVAVGIRLATGSATVATITAAGIVAPLAGGLDRPGVALLVLAIGAGSLFFSHVNDAGFWLVKEYFGMTVGQTIKTLPEERTL